MFDILTEFPIMNYQLGLNEWVSCNNNRWNYEGGLVCSCSCYILMELRSDSVQQWVTICSRFECLHSAAALSSHCDQREGWYILATKKLDKNGADFWPVATPWFLLYRPLWRRWNVKQIDDKSGFFFRQNCPQANLRRKEIKSWGKVKTRYFFVNFCAQGNEILRPRR